MQWTIIDLCWEKCYVDCRHLVHIYLQQTVLLSMVLGAEMSPYRSPHWHRCYWIHGVGQCKGMLVSVEGERGISSIPLTPHPSCWY